MPQEKLNKLAEMDHHNVINQVQEVYLDFQAINPSLYSLDIPSTVNLSTKRPINWGPIEETSFQRMADGLFSILLSARGSNPLVRYDSSSEICTQLAQELDIKISKDTMFVDKLSRGGEAGETTVLILDRREDPITPLLNQWTY